MAISAQSRRELPIETEDDIASVRLAVRGVAERYGLGPFATAAITTASSELTRNALVHGGGGTAIIEEIRDGAALGIRVVFRDEGPGIEDLDRALAGGYSTARSLGLGLAGSRRLVDELHVDTAVGKGTVVTITKWMRGR